RGSCQSAVQEEPLLAAHSSERDESSEVAAKGSSGLVVLLRRQGIPDHPVYRSLYRSIRMMPVDLPVHCISCEGDSLSWNLALLVDAKSSVGRPRRPRGLLKHYCQDPQESLEINDPAVGEAELNAITHQVVDFVGI